MSETDGSSQSEFEYSGWLIFSPLRVNLKGDLERNMSISSVEQVLSERLSGYESGSPNNPGGGFSLPDTRDLFTNTELPEEINHDNLVHIRYTDEEYDSRFTYESSSEEMSEERYVNISQTNIYWKFPDYLFIKGASKEVSRIQSRIKSQLINSLYLEQFDIAPDFLIWILYKMELGEGISSALTPRAIQEIEVEGGDNVFGEKVRVENPSFLSPLLLQVFSENSIISHMVIRWTYASKTIVAELSGGRIHIRVSDGALSEMSDLQRVGFSLGFMSELMELYEYWQNLSTEEKYPPVDFIKEVYDSARDRGFDAHISMDVIERYRQLREGSE
ncbi:hypothetical protein [Halolamina salifodinae]|uniref:Uncharacterized protein n=1 Tax=Halolamina salifodinae TaxID=1202767 RepID=A0A8T4GV77_9EURY|nr:hypothetical protein [Halolamina salifodinae]MBP1986022.1 hypothetical protein [Halolamina salifodinae]